MTGPVTGASVASMLHDAARQLEGVGGNVHTIDTPPGLGGIFSVGEVSGLREIRAAHVAVDAAVRAAEQVQPQPAVPVLDSGLYYEIKHHSHARVVEAIDQLAARYGDNIAIPQFHSPDRTIPPGFAVVAEGDRYAAELVSGSVRGTSHAEALHEMADMFAEGH